MRQFYYVIHTLLRGRGSNVTKIISLTLGLFVGILLFARVAFEMSFDSNYRGADKICVINALYTIGGIMKEPMQVVMGPIPSTIGEAFPGNVESFTIVSEWHGDNTLFHDNVRMQPKIIMSDSLFFQTMGIEVLKGDPRELANPETMFISESFGRKAFGGENPVGKTLLYNRCIPMTVKGVYADLPENTSLRHDVVISFSTIVKNNWAYTGWNGGDSFQGFVRLRNASDMDKVNAGIDRVIEKHMPYQPENGFGVKYSLQPLREVYIQSDTVKRMVMIMSLLGVAILLIAALNYALISISSLARRSKAVGVHKCNGASGSTVFGMFLWETGIIILISLLLVGLIMINFRDTIQDMAAASLGALFTWQSLWVPSVVVVFLFIVAGVFPGRLLARIPVTQLFHRYTDGKRGWKRSLLFIQFAGVTFIFGLLCVVLLQYHRVMTKDKGYNPDNVAYTYYSFPGGKEAGIDALRLLPMVESVSVCSSDITSGYGGMPMKDENGHTVFTARLNQVAYNYADFMDIKLVQGRQLRDSMECLINEEFARRMRWSDGGIGKKYLDFTIVGVMGNFPVSSYYSSQDAVGFVAWPLINSCWHVRLKEPFTENLRELNKVLADQFPTNDIVFKSLQKTLVDQYQAIRRFRDAVLLAAVSILLIALMGLIGYINDETRRRSKEIAIRKVNGAEVVSILHLLSKDVVITALPAIVTGAAASYFVGLKWLGQFAEQITLNPFYFVWVALGVLAIILSSVIFRGWGIANENPVNSIKSE